MPNGDMSPMEEYEIEEFLTSLLTLEEMRTVQDGGGFPSTEELIERADRGGSTLELLVQVFGEDALRDSEE